MSAVHGHLTILKTLIPHTKKLDAVDNKGRSMIHFAAMEGHAHIVKEMLPIIGGAGSSGKII